MGQIVITLQDKSALAVATVSKAIRTQTCDVTLTYFSTSVALLPFALFQSPKMMDCCSRAPQGAIFYWSSRTNPLYMVRTTFGSGGPIYTRYLKILRVCYSLQTLARIACGSFIVKR